MSEKSAGDRNDCASCDAASRIIKNDGNDLLPLPLPQPQPSASPYCPRCFFDWLSSVLPSDLSKCSSILQVLDDIFPSHQMADDNDSSDQASNLFINQPPSSGNPQRTTNNCKNSVFSLSPSSLSLFSSSTHCSLPKSIGQQYDDVGLPLERITSRSKSVTVNTTDDRQQSSPRLLSSALCFDSVILSHYTDDAFSSPQRDQERRRQRRRLKHFLHINGSSLSCVSSTPTNLCWPLILNPLSSLVPSSRRRVSLIPGHHNRSRTFQFNVTTKNTFLFTTFYILSVFLFLSGFLPVSVADSLLLTATGSSSPSKPVLAFQPNYTNTSSSDNDNSLISSYPSSTSTKINNDNNDKSIISNRRHRDVPAVQPSMPIFRSAEYLFGIGPTSNYDTPAAEEAIGLAIDHQEVHSATSAAVNTTTIHTKGPPVVWVPYLGVVVIFAVFMVLIVTFWLHFRRSRYRAIQLVKSSPNSEWNEIQPGRWEASYGGHVYTVNQINQTRVLGAIAAAAAAAMGQGVRRVLSSDRIGVQNEDGGESQVPESTTVAEVEDDERTGLLISQAERSPSINRVGFRSGPNASVVAATTTAAGDRSSVPSSSTNPVPISDSIWLLTEEQLMESIRSSNDSHKSTPAPTPTTATTVTGDGASSSTAGSVTSTTRRSKVPPPVPPRTYGTFSPSRGQTSPPAPHEAIAKLAKVDSNSSSTSQPAQHNRVAPTLSSHSKTYVPGEFALEMIKSPSPSGPELVSLDTMMESEDICGDLPLPPATPSLPPNDNVAVGWSNESFSSEPGDDIVISPTTQLSLDEMTLPEPEPWTPNANVTYAAVPVPRANVGRIPLGGRSNSANSSSASLQNQGGSSPGGAVGGINMIQSRRISSVRGSVRGRGRGAAGRGQMSSLIAYSNMSKKKGGFIIPRG